MLARCGVWGHRRQVKGSAIAKVVAEGGYNVATCVPPSLPPSLGRGRLQRRRVWHVRAHTSLACAVPRLNRPRRPSLYTAPLYTVLPPPRLYTVPTSSDHPPRGVGSWDRRDKQMREQPSGDPVVVESRRYNKILRFASPLGGRGACCLPACLPARHTQASVTHIHTCVNPAIAHLTTCTCGRHGGLIRWACPLQ